MRLEPGVNSVRASRTQDNDFWCNRLFEGRSQANRWGPNLSNPMHFCARDCYVQLSAARTRQGGVLTRQEIARVPAAPRPLRPGVVAAHRQRFSVENEPRYVE